jgi:molybdate transport system ATP-binding protein
MAALSADFQATAGSFHLQAAFHVPGGTAAILGPSGAGKTLTLRSVAGLARPVSGTIALGGRTLFDAKHSLSVATNHRRLGYVFQEYALFPHLRVWENLVYPLAAWPKQKAKERASQLLGLLRLQGLEERRPTELSAGQKQRVALGRALAASPQLLLLDEPFSALDTPIRASLTEQFRELQAQMGFTALLVTHDVAEAYSLSSHLIVMEQGRVLQQGERASVYHQPANPEAARLLGVQNIMTGTVVANEGHETVIDVDGVRLRTLSSGLRRGERVAVGIRAEEIVAQPVGAAIVNGDNRATDRAPGGGLPARLEQVIDRGSRQRLLLRLRVDDHEGPRVVVEATGSRGYHEGGASASVEWTVDIPATAVHLWPGVVHPASPPS